MVASLSMQLRFLNSMCNFYTMEQIFLASDKLNISNRAIAHEEAMSAAQSIGVNRIIASHKYNWENYYPDEESAIEAAETKIQAFLDNLEKENEIVSKLLTETETRIDERMATVEANKAALQAQIEGTEKNLENSTAKFAEKISGGG